MSSFFKPLQRWYRRNQASRSLVNSVVEKVDPQLKQVRNYRKQLLAPIITCQKHSRYIVEAIPGPVQLDSAKFSDHPLINAVFIGQDDIEPLLADAALSVGDLDSSSSARVALLTMTHKEKETFGHRAHKDMLVGQERLISVTFADHKIYGLAESYESTLKKLEQVIFDLIIEAASQAIALKKTDLEELKNRKEKLNAMWRIFGGASSSHEIDMLHPPEDLEKLMKVQELMQETDQELSESLQVIETPEERLMFLKNYLARPEAIFNIHKITYRLDWQNVITEDSEQSAHTITLAQCSLGQNVTRDAVLISYST